MQWERFNLMVSPFMQWNSYYWMFLEWPFLRLTSHRRAGFCSSCHHGWGAGSWSPSHHSKAIGQIKFGAQQQPHPPNGIRNILWRYTSGNIPNAWVDYESGDDEAFHQLCGGHYVPDLTGSWGLFIPNQLSQNLLIGYSRLSRLSMALGLRIAWGSLVFVVSCTYRFP